MDWLKDYYKQKNNQRTFYKGSHKYLNKRLKIEPYKMTKINEMMSKLKCSKYAMSHDLNME